MSENRVLEILRSSNALLEGHFRYTSGRHGSEYFEKIRIVLEPRFVDELGRMMAMKMNTLKNEIDVVCAPAYGAIVFGFSTALHMGKTFAFLQRNSNGDMSVRSGFRDLVAGSRILLIEDVSTTGGSIIESVRALEALNARVVQVGLIVDRTAGTMNIGIPYKALLSVKAESWPQDECPLCSSSIPITTPGSSGKTGV